LKDLPDLTERRLLVVERIEQTEDHRGAGVDFCEECRKPVHDGLLHLIAGEAARDENAMEKIVDIQFSLPCKTGKEVDVEPVAPVDHRNGRTVYHAVCRHPERKQKDRFVAVKKIRLAGRDGEVLKHRLIGDRRKNWWIFDHHFSTFSQYSTAASMCGRYVFIDGKKVLATFALLQDLDPKSGAFKELPRYNASPLQRMPVFAVRDGTLTAEQMRWGLVPHWSKDGKVAFSTFNAKAETLDQSKLYSTYFKGSRCLIPADGFYEWKKSAVTKEVRGAERQVIEKQPMCIRMKDESPFMFAGLFSVWKDPEGKEFPSYTIITTEPNELVGKIHDRMPVILHEKNFEAWLDRDMKDTAAFKKFLSPYPAAKMKAYRVSTVVSSSRNDVPECIKPLKE